MRWIILNILLLGAGGFIGKNLLIKLAKDKNHMISAVDKRKDYFNDLPIKMLENVNIILSPLDENTDFDKLLNSQDVVIHLVSSNIPSTSNQNITEDIARNLSFSSNLLHSCVENHIKRVVFISSGGTVYGKESSCPLNENMPTNPITSYGLQKLSIEKLLYLYNYIYGMDYKIVRLANPYGPYQRPNGVLGVVTTFVSKALNEETIEVYGDGSVIRDFIYIDDVVNAIIKIMYSNTHEKIYNVGSGVGISINKVINTIENALGKKIDVRYMTGRSVDVPINYLDVSQFEKDFGLISSISLYDGVIKTAQFLGKGAV